MKTYPRFKMYELYNHQEKKCKLCSKEMNIHDMETENIIDEILICFECLEEKKNVISNYDKKCSIIDTSMMPLQKFNPPSWKFEENVRFNHENKNLLVPPDCSYLVNRNEEEEYESDIDAEEKIESSWYHRARLGDENREIYDDGLDTDFEAVEEYWRLKHEEEENMEDEIADWNVQLVFDTF